MARCRGVSPRPRNVNGPRRGLARTRDHHGGERARQAHPGRQDPSSDTLLRDGREIGCGWITSRRTDNGASRAASERWPGRLGCDSRSSMPNQLGHWQGGGGTDGDARQIGDGPDRGMEPPRGGPRGPGAGVPRSRARQRSGLGPAGRRSGARERSSADACQASRGCRVTRCRRAVPCVACAACRWPAWRPAPDRGPLRPRADPGHAIAWGRSESPSTGPDRPGGTSPGADSARSGGRHAPARRRTGTGADAAAALLRHARAPPRRITPAPRRRGGGGRMPPRARWRIGCREDDGPACPPSRGSRPGQLRVVGAR
jgi:hypothetical protein